MEKDKEHWFWRGQDFVPEAEAIYRIVQQIDKMLANRCVYETRSYYPGYGNLPDHVSVHSASVEARAWCKTHGWDCPNLGGS